MLREFNSLLEGHSHNTINEKAAAITEELCTKLTDNEWKNLKMVCVFVFTL
jgi:hypothetical protein